jgi:hypothetical protein
MMEFGKPVKLAKMAVKDKPSQMATLKIKYP